MISTDNLSSVIAFIQAKAKQIDKEQIVIILVGLCVSYLAFGYAAANLTFAGDDWADIWPHAQAQNWAIEQGRWFTRLIWYFEGPETLMPFLTSNVCAILMIVVAIRIAPIITIGSIGNSLFPVLIIITVPFIMEWYSFEIHHVAMPISLLFAVEGFRAHEQNKIKSIVLFVLSFAIYQGVVSVIFILYLLSTVKNILHSGDVTVKETIKSTSNLLVVGIVSVIIYVITVKLSWVIFDLGAHAQTKYSLTANYVNSPAIFFKQVKTILHLVQIFLFFENSYYPLYLKWIMLIFLCLSFVYIYSKTSQPLFGVVLMLLLILALCSAWITLLIRVDSSVRYAGLVPIGIWIAGIYSYAEAWANTGKKRVAIWGLCATLIVGFIYQHNSAFIALKLKNQRDFDIASKILERVEVANNFDTLSQLRGGVPIMMVGKLGLNNRRPFGYERSSQWYSVLGLNILECGVFDCQVGRYISVFNLIKSHNVTFRGGLNKNLSDYGKEVVERMPTWPDSGSIQVTDRLVVVKLSN